jgi:glyoxylase-like metal-dependent hydrolase (beta-lactamase superfamily II)
VSSLGAELRPGLRRWTAYHAEWKDTVGCTALSRGRELVLVDPLLEQGQWPALERLASGRDLHVVLTVHWHARSSAEIAERLPGTRIWAHSRARAAIARRAPVTDTFRLGDTLPGGLIPLEARPRTEVLLWEEGSGALIAGDVLLGDGPGLRTCPGWWLPGSTSLEELRQTLRPLLELPIELIVVSHGAPRESGARDELAGVLAP